MTEAPHDRHPPPRLFDLGIRRLMERQSAFDAYIHNGDSVADIGCGPGYFTVRFSRLVGPSGKVYAADTGRKAIEILNKKISENGIRNIECYTDSAADLRGIPDSSIDFLLSHRVICCMSDHRKAISEIKRVLKKEGMAFLSVSSFGRRSDSRHVDASEWEDLLSGFRIVKQGRTLTGRWSLVSVPREAQQTR